MSRLLRFAAVLGLIAGAALMLSAAEQNPNQPPGQNPNQPGQNPNQPGQNPHQQQGQRPIDPKANLTGQQIQGRIIRTTRDQVVIETGENREVVIFTRPDTRFMARDRAIQLADLQVGALITAGYVMDSNRYMANTVSVVPALQTDATTQVMSGLQEIEGRIIRTAPDQVVIETNDKRQVTVHTKSHTQFLATQTIRFNDLQPGTRVSVISETQGDQLTAKKLLTAPAPAGAAAPVSTSPPAVASPSGALSPDRPLVAAKTIDGIVVRAVPPTQFVVQFLNGEEVTVHTDAATSYMIAGKAGRYTDLQAGDAVSIQHDVRGERNIARKIVGILAVEGEVIRTVGQNELLLRGTDGRETTVFVGPETRYLLTPTGGLFTDLRPGATVAVYYDQLDRRNQARHIVLPQKRPVKR